MLRIATLAAALALIGCGQSDPNSMPIYGKDSGLPVNCRAYVQVVIDGYRSKQYTADESFAGLERNCGMSGSAWGKS